MDDSTISRIVVETEPDWLRIQDNVAKSMAASMETRLALLPGGKDGAESQALRKELEQRLAKIQEEIWRASRPNLRVNGHDYEHYEPTTEPFDEALDRDIWSLDTERVESEIELGNLRKDRPAFLYKKESDLENRKLHAEWFPEDDEEASQGKAQKKSEPIPEPPRHAEVVQTFNKVVENISELSSTLPDQLSRANRAQNVRTEIANLPL